MLLGMTASRRAGMDELLGTVSVSGASFVEHELSEDDPPPEPKHHESPAKKPRLKALLVQTAPATDPKQPLAFHLSSEESAPASHVAPMHVEPEPSARRKDPVLRLHPGQAPPRSVV